MNNIVLTSYKLDQFKKITFDSTLDVEVLEYKTMNSHRAIIHWHGKGKEFTQDDLVQLRNDIKANLSLSWVGNFGFGLILHDSLVSDDSHFSMVDDWSRSGGSCIWSIVVDHNTNQAKGIHYWMVGGFTKIYEDTLKQYPCPDGTILNRYKTPPQIFRWQNVMKRPWSLLNPKHRPWNPRPKFAPPFDEDEE